MEREGRSLKQLLDWVAEVERRKPTQLQTQSSGEWPVQSNVCRGDITKK